MKNVFLVTVNQKYLKQTRQEARSLKQSKFFKLCYQLHSSEIMISTQLNDEKL